MLRLQTCEDRLPSSVFSTRLEHPCLGGQALHQSALWWDELQDVQKRPELLIGKIKTTGELPTARYCKGQELTRLAEKPVIYNRQDPPTMIALRRWILLQR